MVAYTDASAAGDWVIDLVLRNFGTTAATDVTLEVTPALRRAVGGNQGETTSVPTPELPVLVPGQEWRTLWDTTLARGESDLPERHEATVRFKDSRGKTYESKSILDWSVIMQRHVVTVYGSHHAAQAIREINKTLKKWNESASGGLKVTTRDGDAKEERTREWLEQQRAEQEQND